MPSLFIVASMRAEAVVTRTFCGTCGCPLTFRSTAFEGMLAVRESASSSGVRHAAGADLGVDTGNLPDIANVPFTMEVFTSQRWMIPALEGAQQFQGPPSM